MTIVNGGLPDAGIGAGRRPVEPTLVGGGLDRRRVVLGIQRRGVRRGVRSQLSAVGPSAGPEPPVAGPVARSRLPGCLDQGFRRGDRGTGHVCRSRDCPTGGRAAPPGLPPPPRPTGEVSLSGDQCCRWATEDVARRRSGPRWLEARRRGRGRTRWRRRVRSSRRGSRRRPGHTSAPSPARNILPGEPFEAAAPAFPSQRTVSPRSGWGMNSGFPTAASAEPSGIQDSPTPPSATGRAPSRQQRRSGRARRPGGSADPLDALQQYAGLPVGGFPGAAPAPDPSQLYQPARRDAPDGAAPRRPTYGDPALASAVPLASPQNRTATRAAGYPQRPATVRAHGASRAEQHAAGPARRTVRRPAASPTAASSPAAYPNRSRSTASANASMLAPRRHAAPRPPGLCRPAISSLDVTPCPATRPSAPGTATASRRDGRPRLPGTRRGGRRGRRGAPSRRGQAPPPRSRPTSTPTGAPSDEAPVEHRASGSRRSSRSWPSRSSVPPATSATASSPAPTSRLLARCPGEAGRRRPTSPCRHSLAT